MRIQDLLGVTYRQYDHWLRAGYLHPIGGNENGTQRHLSPEELKIAKLMARLVDVGFAPKHAAHYARTAVTDGSVAKLVMTGQTKIQLSGMFADAYQHAFKEREDRKGNKAEDESES